MCFFALEFNPLNAELNPICHLLTLLGGATIVVVSRLRVKSVDNSVESTNNSKIIYVRYYNTFCLVLSVPCTDFCG